MIQTAWASVEHYQSSEDVVVILCHHSHHLGLKYYMEGKGIWGGGHKGETERSKKQWKKSAPQFTININDHTKKQKETKCIYNCRTDKITGPCAHIDSCLIPQSLQRSQEHTDEKFNLTKVLSPIVCSMYQKYKCNTRTPSPAILALTLKEWSFYSPSTCTPYCFTHSIAIERPVFPRVAIFSL